MSLFILCDGIRDSLDSIGQLFAIDFLSIFAVWNMASLLICFIGDIPDEMYF